MLLQLGRCFQCVLFPMNQEKQVTITDIKAKFTKDFDNAGTMSCFLEFSAGKCLARTQNVQAQGKQPVWKDSVVLTYFDETSVSVRSYEGEETDKEYMGSGKLQIKSFRFPGGALDLTLTSDNGQILGSVSAAYTIKNLNAVPLLIVKNPKNKNLSKTRPFIQLSADQTVISTDFKEEVMGTSLVWQDSLRIRIKQTSKINLSMIDKSQCTSYLFSFDCNAKQFRCQNGNKKINVFDKQYCLLGQLTFQYETVNLVSKQQSVKNAEKDKKSQNELTIISLDELQYSLPKDNADIMFKIIIGNNCYQSSLVQKADKNGKIPIKSNIYADSKENKLIVTVWQKTVIKNQLLSSGYTYLDSLNNGSNTICLNNQSGSESGNVSLNLSTKQATCSSLVLSNISINIEQQQSLTGNSQPFLMASVGSCMGRTQTGSQNKVTFKKNIQLKFCQEDTVKIQIWDQDVASNSLLYSQSSHLGSFKQKGQRTLQIIKQGQDNKQKIGKVAFKYEYKNNQQIQRKLSFKQQKKKQPLTEQQKDKYIKRHTIPSKADINNTLSNDRSRQTINLPSIVAGNNHQAYGDRIFDRQSAATLQKSILAYSMPKANRFNSDPKYSGQPSYCLDSCFRKNATKGVGFGFGSKKQFPDWMEKNMKENPAPGAYFDGQNDFRSRGPTFGISHKFYERVMIPRQKKATHVPTTRKLSPIRDPAPK